MNDDTAWQLTITVGKDGTYRSETQNRVPLTRYLIGRALALASAQYFSSPDAQVPPTAGDETSDPSSEAAH